MGLATGAVLLLGMAAVRPPVVVEAEEFILRSTDGTARAALTVRPDQTPGLCLFDARGKPRLSLDLAKDGAPGVHLYNKEGVLRAALAVRPDGTPGLGLADPKGKITLSLDLGTDRSAGFNLHSSEGVLRAALAVRADGTPALGLFDERGIIERSFEIDAQAIPIALCDGRSPLATEVHAQPTRGDNGGSPRSGRSAVKHVP